MTRPARLLCSIMLVSLLTACGSAEWVHPTRPKDQYAQDYNKCQADTLRDPKLQQGIQLLIIQATERCLQKQGWRLVEKE
ncbi:hypothetical protein [Nitrospira defluvii]|uniref:Lipoprotein n=1 Tax=Nitrospira defluvii TaxID=330214 RepID=A0ABM8RWN2_9BACT|nr:hypothetical protein [Nitrospira defluvii]MBA5875039.1 hypothetical protein [Nitrospira sp. CR1.2]CAE6775875.1 conserved exported hypothetical protein [Nitrospira defluvii]